MVSVIEHPPSHQTAVYPWENQCGFEQACRLLRLLLLYRHAPRYHLLELIQGRRWKQTISYQGRAKIGAQEYPLTAREGASGRAFYEELMESYYNCIDRWHNHW